MLGTNRSPWKLMAMDLDLIISCDRQDEVVLQHQTPTVFDYAGLISKHQGMVRLTS